MDAVFDIGLKPITFSCDGALFVATGNALFETVETSIAAESFRVVCDIIDVELKRVDCRVICSLLEACFSAETSYVSPHTIAVFSFVKNSLIEVNGEKKRKKPTQIRTQFP